MFQIKEYYDCIIRKHGEGRHVRYDIVSHTEGPICSINLPEYGRAEDVIAIKDYSEDEGIVEWLEKNNIIISVEDVAFSGFVSIPIVKIDADKLMNL